MNAETEIREALAAGPTPGPWFAPYGGGLEGPNDSTVAQGDYEHDVFFPLEATRQYVATCNPTNIAELLKELDARQAKIDALMLEYCPSEMSDAQFAKWASHQKPVSAEKVRAIDAAIGQNKLAELQEDNKKLLSALSDLTHGGEFACWVATQEMCWAAGREFDEAYELVEEKRKKK